MTRIIFHIDVNSAYLSWTAISLLKKGEPTDLRTIPSIIGGSIEDRHGIVLAKSTPAKKHGIVTGEPIIQAMQKCPNLIAYPPDFALYSKCSRAMFDILSEYSDRIEPFSIDEGFLDYTGMEALFGPPIEAAKAIQKRILAARFRRHSARRQVHGNSMEDIREKPGLSSFLQEKRFERYVVLGNRRGPGTVEAVYDAAGEELICG